MTITTIPTITMKSPRTIAMRSPTNENDNNNNNNDNTDIDSNNNNHQRQ